MNNQIQQPEKTEAEIQNALNIGLNNLYSENEEDRQKALVLIRKVLRRYPDYWEYLKTPLEQALEDNTFGLETLQLIAANYELNNHFFSFKESEGFSIVFDGLSQNSHRNLMITLAYLRKEDFINFTSEGYTFYQFKHLEINLSEHLIKTYGPFYIDKIIPPELYDSDTLESIRLQIVNSLLEAYYDLGMVSKEGFFNLIDHVVYRLNQLSISAIDDKNLDWFLLTIKALDLIDLFLTRLSYTEFVGLQEILDKLELKFVISGKEGLLVSQEAKSNLEISKGSSSLKIYKHKAKDAFNLFKNLTDKLNLIRSEIKGKFDDKEMEWGVWDDGDTTFEESYKGDKIFTKFARLKNALDSDNKEFLQILSTSEHLQTKVNKLVGHILNNLSNPYTYKNPEYKEVLSSILELLFRKLVEIKADNMINALSIHQSLIIQSPLLRNELSSILTSAYGYLGDDPDTDEHDRFVDISNTLGNISFYTPSNDEYNLDDFYNEKDFNFYYQQFLEGLKQECMANISLENSTAASILIEKLNIPADLCYIGETRKYNTLINEVSSFVSLITENFNFNGNNFNGIDVSLNGQGKYVFIIKVANREDLKFKERKFIAPIQTIELAGDELRFGGLRIVVEDQKVYQAIYSKLNRDFTYRVYGCYVYGNEEVKRDYNLELEEALFGKAEVEEQETQVADQIDWRNYPEVAKHKDKLKIAEGLIITDYQDLIGELDTFLAQVNPTDDILKNVSEIDITRSIFNGEIMCQVAGGWPNTYDISCIGLDLSPNSIFVTSSVKKGNLIELYNHDPINVRLTDNSQSIDDAQLILKLDETNQKYIFDSFHGLGGKQIYAYQINGPIVINGVKYELKDGEFVKIAGEGQATSETSNIEQKISELKALDVKGVKGNLEKIQFYRPMIDELLKDLDPSKQSKILDAIKNDSYDTLEFGNSFGYFVGCVNAVGAKTHGLQDCIGGMVNDNDIVFSLQDGVSACRTGREKARLAIVCLFTLIEYGLSFEQSKNISEVLYSVPNISQKQDWDELEVETTYVNCHINNSTDGNYELEAEVGNDAFLVGINPNGGISTYTFGGQYNYDLGGKFRDATSESKLLSETKDKLLPESLMGSFTFPSILVRVSIKDLPKDSIVLACSDGLSFKGDEKAYSEVENIIKYLAANVGHIGKAELLEIQEKLIALVKANGSDDTSWILGILGNVEKTSETQDNPVSLDSYPNVKRLSDLGIKLIYKSPITDGRNYERLLFNLEQFLLEANISDNELRHIDYIDFDLGLQGIFNLHVKENESVRFSLKGLPLSVNTINFQLGSLGIYSTNRIKFKGGNEYKESTIVLEMDSNKEYNLGYFILSSGPVQLIEGDGITFDGVRYTLRNGEFVRVDSKSEFEIDWTKYSQVALVKDKIRSRFPIQNQLPFISELNSFLWGESTDDIVNKISDIEIGRAIAIPYCKVTFSERIAINFLGLELNIKGLTIMPSTNESGNVEFKFDLEPEIEVEIPNYRKDQFDSFEFIRFEGKTNYSFSKFSNKSLTPFIDADKITMRPILINGAKYVFGDVSGYRSFIKA